MWMMGFPAGFCDKDAYGEQLPFEVLRHTRARFNSRLDVPYCHGPCCPAHGGPAADEIRVFQDGLTEQGSPMWCAVYPDFINLQESPAGFDGNPFKAIANLKTAATALPGQSN